MRLLTDRGPAPVRSCARRAALLATAGIGDLGGAAPLVPLCAWWAVWHGGEPESVWLAALPLLAAAALLLAVFRRPSRPAGWLRASLVAGAALTSWSALSLLWAANPGDALTATERLGLYAGCYCTVVLWPPSHRGLRLLVAAFVAGGLAAAVVVLGGSGGGGRLLIDGRLAGPTGYPNATAAFFAMTGLAAVGSAAASGSRRATAAWAGAAGILFAVGLLAQSRGAAAVLGLTVAVAVALSRGRLAMSWVVAALATSVLAFSGPLLDVRTQALAGVRPGPAAAAAVLGTGLLAAVLAGGAHARRRRRGRRPGRRALRWTGALAGALAGAAVIVAWTGALPGGAGISLAAPDYAHLEAGSSRYTGDIRSYRPDYWRVALAGGADHPLLGVGSGGFRGTYLRDRRTTKAPEHAHSTWLETFAELGAPGLALLLLAAGSLAGAVRAALRRAADGSHAISLAATLPAAFLALHASVDWVAMFPALTVPALALAAAAAADSPRRRPVPRRVLIAGGAALVLLGGLALVGLGAVRLTDHALAIASVRPAAAIDELRLAARLDPLGARAALALGVVATQSGRLDVAARALSLAAQRDHADWFARYAAGLVAGARGQPSAAEGWLRAAQRRNPREPLVAAALAAARRGRAVAPLSGIRRALAEPG